MHDNDGRRMTVKARQSGDPSMDAALNQARIESERMATWVNLDEPERHMVQAVVLAALNRLRESPHWIPGATRLGRNRLDIFIVVELDADQVEAAQAAADLDADLARAQEALAKAMVILREDDDGTAP